MTKYEFKLGYARGYLDGYIERYGKEPGILPEPKSYPCKKKVSAEGLSYYKKGWLDGNQLALNG